ncbi:hypothetical protein L3049_03115 [Labilibaculum sp. DW002]|uniref:Uncharacterized protein n=1 Tax=Paralabilibaculum antarcticum TaxID=2912572 RepID=A0ABT5VNZ8_9BACT|nr:hypothetical protein [Labilibaculum sp. DW002]MDE5416985.1 hypothetical protein [Labilibaculum sp. DW002]
MEKKIIFIILGIILLVVIGYFYFYSKALASMWVLNKPDQSPYFVTTKPITIKNILLPKGTKVTYKKRNFWEKYEQEKLLNENDISDFSFAEGTALDWGGVPITSIVKFYNSEMKGFTVYADFDSLDKSKETEFSNLWQNCNSSLGITVKNTDDWSFNKQNILDVESCSVSYQRYFKDDAKQQKFLDDLYNELMKIGG